MSAQIVVFIIERTKPIQVGALVQSPIIAGIRAFMSVRNKSPTVASNLPVYVAFMEIIISGCYYHFLITTFPDRDNLHRAITQH